MSLDTGGATYGGIALSSLGLTLIKPNISLMPDTRQTEEELPGMDGSLEQSVSYGPRLISLEVMLQAGDEIEYQIRLQQIAQLFNAHSGVKPLILDRMPGKRWLCKYNGSIAIEKMAQLAAFTLPLKAYYPFAESVLDSLQPLELGQGYTFGMGLRLGDGYSFAVQSPSVALTVYNAGTYDAYPIIRLTGSGSDIAVTNETTQQTFAFSKPLTGASVVEFNCAPLEQTASFDGANAAAWFSGVFPKLAEGENSFAISAANPDLTVEFEFRHTYLY